FCCGWSGGCAGLGYQPYRQVWPVPLYSSTLIGAARSPPAASRRFRTPDRRLAAFFMLGDMTIQRMDNVAIVVDDLDAAVAFFTELGMELEGKGQIEGLWADRTVGLDGVRSNIAMMRTPDGHSKLELTKYHTPAASGAEPENPP